MRSFTIAILATVSLQAAEVSKDEQLQLAGCVHVIFERKCNECHGSQTKKPGGKFGYVLDLKKVADNGDYIVRGKPDESDLFRMLRDREMPPDDHPKTPPLTKVELEWVQRWILAGSPSAIPAMLPDIGESNPTTTRVETKASEVSVTAKERAAIHVVSLEFINRPTSEVFVEIARQSGIAIRYSPAGTDPIVSIRLKKGTVMEALRHLVLCANLSIRFDKNTAFIEPNPPLTPERPNNRKN